MIKIFMYLIVMALCACHESAKRPIDLFADFLSLFLLLRVIRGQHIAETVTLTLLHALTAAAKYNSTRERF